MKNYKQIIWFFVLMLLPFGCEIDAGGDSVPTQGVQFPVGIAVHPGGYLLVASSNFDLKYKNGGLQVIDLNKIAAKVLNPEGKEPIDNTCFLKDKAIGLPNFASGLKYKNFSSTEEEEQKQVVAVLVRETDELIVIKVNEDAEGNIDFDCWPKGERPGGDYPECEGSLHRIALQGTDPYDLLLLEDANGEHQTAYVTFLGSRFIEEIDISGVFAANETNALRSIYTPNTAVGSNNEITQSPSSGFVYITPRSVDQYSNPISFFDPSMVEPDFMAEIKEYNLYQLFKGLGSKSITFTNDKKTAAMLTQAPNIVAFINTSVIESAGVGVAPPKHAFLGSIPLDSNATRIRAHQKFSHLFVTATKADTVYVADTDTKNMIDIREDICVGPFDIAFWDDDSRDIHWAIIGCFEDSSIQILQNDPSKDDFLAVIASLGST